jgi:hypothetical protein
MTQVPENLKMLSEIINSCWPACVETDPLSSDQRSHKPYPPLKTCRLFMADAIISNPVTYGHIHCAEALGVPLHLMFPQVGYFLLFSSTLTSSTQPWVPTKAFPHPLACLSYSSQENKWSTENYLSYQVLPSHETSSLSSVGRADALDFSRAIHQHLQKESSWYSSNQKRGTWLESPQHQQGSPSICVILSHSLSWWYRFLSPRCGRSILFQSRKIGSLISMSSDSFWISLVSLHSGRSLVTKSIHGTTDLSTGSSQTL